MWVRVALRRLCARGLVDHAAAAVGEDEQRAAWHELRLVGGDNQVTWGGWHGGEGAGGGRKGGEWSGGVRRGGRGGLERRARAGGAGSAADLAERGLQLCLGRVLAAGEGSEQREGTWLGLGLGLG